MNCTKCNEKMDNHELGFYDQGNLQLCSGCLNNLPIEIRMDIEEKFTLKLLAYPDLKITEYN